MNGPIAQLVALACHANARLQGRPAPRFFPGNSTGQFCDSISFVRPKRGLLSPAVREALVAADPDAWFEHLKDAGCRAVLLHHARRNEQGFSDRMTAVFVGGGGRWMLETRRPESSDSYEARWEVWNQNAPERRIWRVTYVLTAEDAPVQTHVAADFSVLKADLADALREIEDFARRRNLSGFADAFENALDCLSSDNPLERVYHRDLAPAGMLDRDGERLLSAVQSAWVFGGMGSWNDLNLEGADQDDYQTLSDRLFTVTNGVISAAANRSAG